MTCDIEIEIYSHCYIAVHGMKFLSLPEVSHCRREYCGCLWFCTYFFFLSYKFYLFVHPTGVNIIPMKLTVKAMALGTSMEAEFHLKVVSSQLHNMVSIFLGIK